MTTTAYQKKVSALLLQFSKSIGHEFTVGGSYTLWRNDDEESLQPFPGIKGYDIVVSVNKDTGIITGNFVEAPVDICRLKQ